MSDEVELKPASENPWYVLATIAGEQDEELVDWELHEKNRRYWNGWMVARLSDDERLAILELDGWEESDLAPLSDDERLEIEKAFSERSVELPGDGVFISLYEAEFTHHFIASKFAFSGFAYFASAAFAGFADFTSAAFSGAAFFNSAAFLGVADFTSATFFGGAYFTGKEFESSSYFADARFDEKVDFSDRIFKKAADFRAAHFSGSPPLFYGATLHEDTDFVDVAWPGVPEDRREAIRHRRAYERLKLIMDKQNKVHDEHMFLRKELRCREIEEGYSLAGIGSRLYFLVSEYGWSVSRPLMLMGAFLVLGWLAITISECGHGASNPLFGDSANECAVTSMGLSFASSFGFLGTGRYFLREQFEGLIGWFSPIASTMLMVLVPLMLFFLILALRNRFRIK